LVGGSCSQTTRETRLCLDSSEFSSGGAGRDVIIPDRRAFAQRHQTTPNVVVGAHTLSIDITTTTTTTTTPQVRPSGTQQNHRDQIFRTDDASANGGASAAVVRHLDVTVAAVRRGHGLVGRPPGIAVCRPDGAV